MWADAIWHSIWTSFCPRRCWTPLIPFPSATTPCRRNRGCFTSKGYLTLSGDEWKHEREEQMEKKPSIKERLEQSRKESAGQSKAQLQPEKPAPER